MSSSESSQASPDAAVNVVTQSSKLNCDDYSGGYIGRCFLGYHYSSDGPYTLIDNLEMSPSAGPSSNYTSPFSSFWIGLQNAAGTVLVQAGIRYGNPHGATTPYAFEEIVGDYTDDGTDCSTLFCGRFAEVAAGDNITFAAYYSNGYWYAAYEDSTANFTQKFSIPDNELQNLTSLGYGFSVFEGYNLTSSSQLPSLPVESDTVQLWSGPTSQVPIALDDWFTVNYPVSTSGVPLGTAMSTAPTELWNTPTSYVLDMQESGEGTVTPALGDHSYSFGSQVTVDATGTCHEGISKGVNLDGWTGSGFGSYSGGNNSATVVMVTNVDETARFTYGYCPQLLQG